MVYIKLHDLPLMKLYPYGQMSSVTFQIQDCIHGGDEPQISSFLFFFIPCLTFELHLRLSIMVNLPTYSISWNKIQRKNFTPYAFESIAGVRLLRFISTIQQG